MQHSHFISRMLIALALITLLLVAVHQVLPEKRWEWLPDENVVAHIYADQMHGGNSEAQWISEPDIHFSCEMRPSDLSAPPFCGFHVHFDSPSAPTVDLSGYSRMHINIDYTGGNEKLRFYLTEFVPGYSDPDEPVLTATAKYLSAYVTAAEAENEVVIQMDEFLVADWWVNNNDVPRHFSTPSRSNIITFGVDIAFPTALGYHEVNLNSVTLVGDWVSAERWYLGILVIWILALVVAALARVYYLRKLVQNEQTEKNRYQQLLMLDPLTGLLNRHGLLSYFKNEIALGHSVWPVGMLVIDIDHFKPVNDTFGHNIGDVILQRVADAINAHSRQADKAARWGGEEFVVLLPNTSVDYAQMLAERLRQSVMELRHPEVNNQTITISIGVSEIHSGDQFEEAFDRADAALYRAKNGGRNKVVG